MTAIKAHKRFAEQGQVWVCGACGKTHSDLYGIDGGGSSGWDESCMLNAVLCHSTSSFDEDGTLRWEPIGEDDEPS